MLVHAAEKPTRLFIQSFEKKQGISDTFAEKFKENLLLYFFEQGAGKYRVISESDIKIMYKQAEGMMASGCNAEECLTAIAYAIDADVIIYGNLDKSDGKVNLFAQSLRRNKETDELSKESIIKVSFNESQMNWYSKEIVKKLINPKYYIDPSKAPMEIRVDVAPELLGTTKLKSKKLKLLKFKTDDSALQAITTILKEIIMEGDNHYQKKEIQDARNKYNQVLTKMKTKISTDKQNKLVKLEDDVYERIAATYSSELQETLNQGDENYKKKQYSTAVRNYNNIDTTIDNIQYRKVQSQLFEFKSTTKERRDLVRTTRAKQEISNGDGLYSDYKFEKAIEHYKRAQNFTSDFENKAKEENRAFIKSLDDKIAIAKKTGISYFKNQVQSYCDKIDVFNIKDEVEKAKEMLVEFYDLTESSTFTDSESKNQLKEMAALLNVSEYELEKLKRELALKRKQEEEEERRRAQARKEAERKRLQAIEDEKQRKKEAEQREIASASWSQKRLIIDIESGSGHMFNLFGAYKLGMFSFGLGGAYTFGEQEILGKKFNDHLFNVVGVVNIHLLRSNFVWLDFRQKIGNEWIIMDEWSESGMFLSPGIMVGYHYLFAELAVPMFFGSQGTGMAVQMGAGFRFRVW